MGISGEVDEGDEHPIASDTWLTREDLTWRLGVTEKIFSWREMREYWEYYSRLRKAVFSPPYILVENSHMVMLEAERKLAETCHRSFPLVGKPKSVRLYEWLKTRGLPSVGLEWRATLWYSHRRLTWEYNKWINRMFENANRDRRKMLEGLLRCLPLSQFESVQYRWPTLLSRVGTVCRDRRDASVAYGWLKLHGIELPA